MCLRVTRLAVMLATQPLSKVSRTLAMSTFSESTETPTASTFRIGERT